MHRVLTALVSLSAVAMMATLATPALGVGATTTAGGAAGSWDRLDWCYVTRAHEVFLDRGPSTAEANTWLRLFARGKDRVRLAATLAHRDEWLTVSVSRLYRNALDRAPDPGGLAYWSDRLAAGVPVRHFGALVYGSAEFYARAGGDDEAFVSALYDRILGREPDDAGLAHWVGATDERGRDGVASWFFSSTESRAGRVDATFREVLDRRADPEGRRYWTRALRTINDIELATSLGASTEFYSVAQNNCSPPSDPGTAPPGPAPATDADNASGSRPHGWFEGGRAWRGDFPDPHVVRDGDTFYAYATNTGGRYLPAATSTDLVTWTARDNYSDQAPPWAGGPDPRSDPDIPAEIRTSQLTAGDMWTLNDALVRPPAWASEHLGGPWIDTTYWAPGVIEIGGSWYAYSSVRTRDEPGDVNPYGRFCVSVARGPGPLGPFRDVSGLWPIICNQGPAGSIDPSPFRDPVTGATYLTWKEENRASQEPSSLNAVRLDPNGMPTGAIRELLETREGTWEGDTVEGPSMVAWDGTWYLFYSANSFGGSSYAVGYAVCAGPLGPCERETGGPLMASTPTESGPGGADAFFDTAGRLRLAYHFYWPGEVRRPRPRRMRTAVLRRFANGELYTERP